MKKSNIFAYTELKKLIDNLNQSGRAPRESITSQAAYFHILDPRYFSEELAPEWAGIRQRLGYSPEQAQKGQLMLKSSMQQSIEQLTEAECRDLLAQLRRVYERLSAEFGG
ncbi:MAG: hypothetical protein KKG00_11595 [Bacteroidetes bacterium]|nr:hypothetical protein [Bacteroidota bacterium]